MYFFLKKVESSDFLLTDVGNHPAFRHLYGQVFELSYSKESLQIKWRFAVSHKWFFKWAIPIATPWANKEIANFEIEKFMTDALDFLKRQGIHWVSMAPATSLYHVVPKNSIYAPFGSYRVDLTLSQDQLWQGVHSKHRNVIRNAEKNGLQIQCGFHAQDALYEIFVQTMARSSMGFLNKEAYDRLCEEIVDHAKMYTIWHEGALLGGALIPYDQGRAYYIWGGSVDKPILGAMNFLHWHIMLDLKSNNIREYDFVGARISPEPGSKLEGIQRFKERFGSTMIQGYIWKKVLNPKMYFIYNALIILKNKGNKTLDIVDQELLK